MLYPFLRMARLEEKDWGSAASALVGDRLSQVSVKSQSNP